MGPGTSIGFDPDTPSHICGFCLWSHWVSLRVNGTTFNKILFLNGVVFKMTDVKALLHTNSGIYALA